jgi:Fe-S-cluster-containing hydrogenase component 2
VCEAVCSLKNEGESNPVKSRIKVVRTVEDLILHSIPVFCLQCEEAYCAAVCPVQAIAKDSMGVLNVDENKCIGCKLCEIACPVGAIAVNPEKHVALKCNQCGGDPECVKYCYPEAIRYLPGERVGIAVARSRAGKFMELV